MNNSSIGGSGKEYNLPPAAAAASGVDAPSETDGISVLPPEIMSQVFTLLDSSDVRSTSLVNRSWNVNTIDKVKHEEMKLLQSYSKFLADNLDEEKNPFEKKELLRLSEDNHILNCDSLGEIKVCLLKVRDNIESQLLKLDHEDLENLRELTKNEDMPGLFEAIYDHVDVLKSLREAILINEPIQQSFALQKICKKLVELGEFDKALDVARIIPVGAHADAMLADICNELVDGGHFEKAIKIASTIQTYGVNWTPFENICRGLTESNKFDRAMEVASNLDTNRLRSHAFQGICMSLYSSKQFDKAIEVADRIEEDGLRGVVLQRISQDLLSSGKLEEGIRLAQTIPTVDIRSYALEQICLVLEGEERIDELIEVAVSIPNAVIRDSLLRDVSRRQYKKNQYDNAVKVARSIVGNQSLQENTLGEIAELLVSKGEIGKALEISESMSIQRIKLAIHLAVCQEHAKQGQTEEAKDVANNIPDPRLRAQAFANICHILLAKDINEAKNFAASISDEGVRQYMYGLISSHLFDKGKLMEAAEVANLIPVLNETDDYKAKILAPIARRLLKFNKKDDAMTIINSMPEGRVKNTILYGLDRKDGD